MKRSPVQRVSTFRYELTGIRRSWLLPLSGEYMRAIGEYMRVIGEYMRMIWQWKELSKVYMASEGLLVAYGL